MLYATTKSVIFLNRATPPKDVQCVESQQINGAENVERVSMTGVLTNTMALNFK
jgi:hypothetical protein